MTLTEADELFREILTAWSEQVKVLAAERDEARAWARAWRRMTRYQRKMKGEWHATTDRLLTAIEWHRKFTKGAEAERDQARAWARAWKATARQLRTDAREMRGLARRNDEICRAQELRIEALRAEVERLRAAMGQIDAIGADVQLADVGFVLPLGEKLLHCREIARAALGQV